MTVYPPLLPDWNYVSGEVGCKISTAWLELFFLFKKEKSYKKTIFFRLKQNQEYNPSSIIYRNNTLGKGFPVASRKQHKKLQFYN